MFASSVGFVLLGMKSDSLDKFNFLKGSINDFPVTFASIYAPNVKQRSFLSSVLENLEQFKEVEVVIGGDFNFIVGKKLDKSNFNIQKDKKQNTKTHLASLFDKDNLIDTWRAKNPDLHDYTYCLPRFKTYTRIF